MGKKRRIALDFDGVVATYDGWKGLFAFGNPMPGIKEFLEHLVKKDIEFIVISTRATSPKVKAAMKGWFTKHNLPPPTMITNTKVPAHIYVDDRALFFDGSVEKLKKNIAQFEVHWKKEKRFTDV